MKQYKGVGIGTGYFSGFQYEAWNRMPEVEITALSSRGEAGKEVGEKYGIAKHYTDYRVMIDEEQPDFVDIITPPGTHLEMCKYAADRGIAIICQKPLAPTQEEAKEIVEYAQLKGVSFMVHENWRFQPWYRKIKELLTEGSIGQVHTVNFRSRMGDGWGQNAYIPRQPYFREYPRLLVYENGIHFIDTFRYLFGEVSSVFAKLRKLNPVIQGEDQGIVHFDFENGVQGIWDANRYNEPNYDQARYTFGEMLIDGLDGSIRLFPNGKITLKKLGQDEVEIAYHHENINFSGDCVYKTQRHFIDQIAANNPFETDGVDYLKSIAVQEAVYKSSESKLPETITI
ncbi:MAG: Gfo/Idh/MocA family oxidoreductase [Cyclobacteriaceae bacterium]